MTLYKALVRDYFGWQMPVKDILNDPPGTPAEGDRYLVDSVPTGAWVGHAKEIATYNGSGWDFASAEEGWYVYDQDSNARYVYSGSAWSADATGGEVNTASNYGIGGVGLYDSKSGVDLRFRNINAGSNKITVTLDNPNHEVDLDVAEANIVHNNLSGYAAANHRAVNWSSAQKVITIDI